MAGVWMVTAALAVQLFCTGGGAVVPGPDISAVSSQGSSGPDLDPGGEGGSQNQGRLVDLNQAGMADLCRLPGVGEVIARRIIEYRKSQGRFREIEELLAVKGIGAGRLSKLRELVTVQIVGGNGSREGDLNQ